MIDQLRELVFADAALSAILLPVFLLWLAAWFFLPRWRRSKARGALLYSNTRLLDSMTQSRTVRLRSWVRWIRVIVVLLLLTALMRPQTGRRMTEVQTQGIDIVLAVDTSGSMQALDLDTEVRNEARRRNRLEVAKDVIAQFVTERPNDQLGLVVFGQDAFTQCPLTLDHTVLATLLDGVEIGMAGDATAIGSAVGVAVKRLQDSPAESKVIVLLTDGRNNAGVIAPRTAAEIAQTLGIKIYAIGAGTRGEAPFLVQTPLGPQIVYENVEIDEEMLQEMSEMTGGAYFRAEDVSALAGIYEQIDQLEKTEITTDSYLEFDDRFSWFVVPAAALLLLETLLLYGRLRRLP